MSWDSKSEAPPVVENERSALSVAPELGPRPLPKPVKNTLDCVRHDARSASHTLHGFIELLASGALGPLNLEQAQSMEHLQTAAGRIAELLETSLDLAQEKQPFHAHELTSSRLSLLTSGVVHSLLREQTALRISLELLPEQEELPTLVEPLAFTKVVRALIGLIADNTALPLGLRMAQTDLHTSLVISAREPDAETVESVTQSIPTRVAFSADFDVMARDWRNRDYLRLKRCEALLARQRGRLLVTPDLTRVRLMLPLQRRG